MRCNVARAKVQVSKGQGEHHHDQATHGIKHFFPKLDLEALRGLSVCTQVTDILEQVDRAHAIRFEQGYGNHFRSDASGPYFTVFVFATQRGLGALAYQFVALNALKFPGVVGDHTRFGFG